MIDKHYGLTRRIFTHRGVNDGFFAAQARPGNTGEWATERISSYTRATRSLLSPRSVTIGPAPIAPVEFPDDGHPVQLPTSPVAHRPEVSALVARPESGDRCWCNCPISRHARRLRITSAKDRRFGREDVLHHQMLERQEAPRVHDQDRVRTSPGFRLRCTCRARCQRGWHSSPRTTVRPGLSSIRTPTALRNAPCAAVLPHTLVVRQHHRIRPPSDAPCTLFACAADASRCQRPISSGRHRQRDRATAHCRCQTC